MEKKKQIEYTIVAKIYFNKDENINIEDYLEDLRGSGSAEVTDVKIVEVDTNDLFS